MSSKGLNVTLKGIQEINGLWHAFVERHEPCLAPHGDHEGCTVVQRALSVPFRTKEGAVWACENVQVIASESGPVDDWEIAGS